MRALFIKSAVMVTSQKVNSNTAAPREVLYMKTFIII